MMPMTWFALNILELSSWRPGAPSFDVDGVEVRVTNVLGRLRDEETVRSPFEAMDEPQSRGCDLAIHIVDFHAESTSEKAIFGYSIDGKVSAVLGTHTHVQTNDAKSFRMAPAS
jgi:calcineurin-like phosphoesterase